MGADGLRRATGAAVLSANYIAARLREHFPVLYAGDNGLVAHECILDLRPLREATGVTVDDVAKRLIDYGFHAPDDVVPGRGHAHGRADRERGPRRARPLHRRDDRDQGRGGCRGSRRWPADDNPLVNAPHTAAARRSSGEWTHAYTREQAVYPVPGLRAPQVLAAGAPHRPGVRRPQPDVRVPADRGVRVAHRLQRAAPAARVPLSRRRGSRRQRVLDQAGGAKANAPPDGRREAARRICSRISAALR